MKYVSLLLLGVAFAAGGAIASPQSHGHAHAAPAENASAAPTASEDIARAFDALDANRDGQLSREELAKHPMGAHASMVDADKAGALSREEFKALQDM